MRTRRLLEAASLPEFKAFCHTQGWKEIPPLGVTDAIRMAHPRRHTFTIGATVPTYGFNRSSRYAIYDEASRMFDEWKESQNAAESTHSVQKAAA